MGRVSEQLGKGGWTCHSGMNGESYAPRRQTLFKGREGPGVEAELSGDVHFEAGRLAVGLLALERLPEDLVGDRRVTFGVAGHAQTLDPDVAEHTAVEQIEGTGKGSGRRRQITRDQQRLLYTTRDERVQSLAQSLRIDDATRDDVWRGREAQCLEAQRDPDYVIG
jgi:hypothetical protein